MLDDNAPELQSYSLRKLNGPSGYKDVGNRSMLVVESFWHEIDDHLPRLETLYEDNNFPDRKLAALVASKVHFYLSSYDLAMTYALGAEDLFDITEKSSYVQKVCMSRYSGYSFVLTCYSLSLALCLQRQYKNRFQPNK